MNNILKNTSLLKNKWMINSRLEISSKLKIMVPLLSTLFLVSCNAGSRTSFQCPSASGLTCMPVDRVYAMIESGEVEHIENQLLCSGKKRCSKEDFKPELKMNRTYQAELKEPEDPQTTKIDNTLYID